MTWQYTLTKQEYQRVVKREMKGFSEKQSFRGSSSFFYGFLIYLILLLSLFLHAILSIQRGEFSFLPFLERLLFLIGSFAVLYYLIMRQNPLSLLKKASDRSLFFCSLRAENGWFYFLRSFSNGEYYFFQKPLREITRIHIQNQGILIEFSGDLCFFLPQAAFFTHSVLESSRFFQKECLDAHSFSEIPRPLDAPFSDMLRITEAPLHSCAFQIPQADRAGLYLECQKDVRRHRFYYLEENNLFLILLCLLFCLAAHLTGWSVLLFAGILLFLAVFVLYPFVLLPRSLKKQGEHFSLLSSPCKITLYSQFLTISTPDSILLRPYVQFADLYQTRNCYYLAVKKPVLVHIIPKKAFSDVQEEARFTDCLQTGIISEKFFSE